MFDCWRLSPLLSTAVRVAEYWVPSSRPLTVYRLLLPGARVMFLESLKQFVLSVLEKERE